MKIRELRILPPFAIGRLGSAKEPQENYTIVDNPNEPLGYRRIIPAKTLKVRESTGEIASATTPKTISFKIDGKIRPVAPFLEVFAVVEKPQKDKNVSEEMAPLDGALLRKLGASAARVEWRVSVANRKVMRRTGNPNDEVTANTGWFSDHDNHVLLGSSKNFIPGGRINFGQVRFIRPNKKFGEIRLRFTPAHGLIYGPHRKKDPTTRKPDPAIPPERAIYDDSKDWVEFGKDPDKVENQTLPPSLYAIEPPAPSWLNDNKAVSRGYLDDACDGFVEVRLTLPTGKRLTATARICAAPPAVVPDSLFIRSLADDLEQVIYGPEVPKNEPYEVTRNRALDIVRRAYETVRFMNVAVMNGNNFKGRPALLLDSMPEEEAADTERAIRPVMAPGSVDTLGIMTLHEQVFAALRGGAAPWFVKLLRRPDEVADFTDRGRRKMPALMCGADNSYLALTYRQIDSIRKVSEEAPFRGRSLVIPAPSPDSLTALNLTAQLHYEALGNPISSRPVTSVANCCPGLEVDFRAVWRRMFKGIVLREYDNLVMDVDPDVKSRKIKALVGSTIVARPAAEGQALAHQKSEAVCYDHSDQGTGVVGCGRRNQFDDAIQSVRSRIHGVVQRTGPPLEYPSGKDSSVRLYQGLARRPEGHAAAHHRPSHSQLCHHRVRSPKVLRRQHSRYFKGAGQPRRAYPGALFSVAERLSRVFVLLLGVGASGLH